MPLSCLSTQAPLRTSHRTLHIPSPRLIVLASLLILVACGSSSGPPDDEAPPPPSQANFAGTYSTQVSLTQSNCTGITVQNNPTTVTHNAATGAISMSHAGITYAGTVAIDSTFATTPRSVDVGDGYSYTIAIAGRFRPNAFEADATVDRRAEGSNCRFVVRWIGTR